MHTVLRFFAAAWGALKIILVFSLWAVPVALMGEADAALSVMGFVLVFFAPAGWANAWSDFGD